MLWKLSNHKFTDTRLALVECLPETNAVMRLFGWLSITNDNATNALPIHILIFAILWMYVYLRYITPPLWYMRTISGSVSLTAWIRPFDKSPMCDRLSAFLPGESRNLSRISAVVMKRASSESVEEIPDDRCNQFQMTTTSSATWLSSIYNVRWRRNALLIGLLVV